MQFTYISVDTFTFYLTSCIKILDLLDTFSALTDSVTFNREIRKWDLITLKMKKRNTQMTGY